MRTGIRIVPNHSINKDVWFPLEIFLSDWLSDICNNDFTIVKEQSPTDPAIYSIMFDYPEDASFIKLRNLPTDLSKYIHLK